ncbi:26S proteasome non-ATPase regulatory subunit 5-like [Haliotis rubra]|uniref:26S proteasome non-ATPase regulatory subunit 5-like n=1 Tax=Haliotis rubra TaxID=36100 RepID=UPI001EE60DD6|nr:26S proteasome non-ATPase regulatory subunit 5-like [Haliotis rubra]
MAAAVRVAELLDSLPNSDDPKAVLESVQTIVTTVHPSTLRDVIPNVSFANIFDCLNHTDTGLLNLGCDVLDRLMSSVSPALVLHNFKVEFNQCLIHPALPVKLLALKQLSRASVENVCSLFEVPELVLKVADHLADDSLTVAKPAGVILTNLGKMPDGLAALYSPEMEQRLQKAMEKNDTVRFILFQIVVDISRASPIGLQRSAEAGYIQQLVSEVHKDDILVQLNCLELMSDLAQEQHGIVFLDEQGIVGKMEDMMSNVESDPMAGFLLPGLMKFFGGLARYHPKEVCGKFNKFTNLVFHSVDGGDSTLQATAIDTIGFIGSTTDGKLALEKLGSQMTGYMKRVGKLIQNSISETKTRCLQAVASLLQLKVEDQTAEFLALTETWFSHLFPKPFDVLWDIVKQPFSDLRCSTYGIFQALALQPWGQKLMNEAPGFCEFVLDRTTENCKEGKESKYEVICTLAQSPTVIDSFGRPFYVRVMEYYKQGAFYVQAQSEVALEDGGS